MQKAGEGVCMWRGSGEQYAEMRGGWKQNRTALTTEPKDKEKIGLADRKRLLGGLELLHEG